MFNVGSGTYQFVVGDGLFAATQAGGTVGGTVPATLALTLGAPATFGPFTPGVAKEYTANTNANVISTAGDARADGVRSWPPHQRHVLPARGAAGRVLQGVVDGPGVE